MINLTRLCLLISLALPGFKENTGTKADLTITISSLRDTEHDIYISVNPRTARFPDQLQAVSTQVVSPSGKKSISIVLKDIPYGKYAVMVFQDLNNNKKLDKNFLGIPTEPIAFSNNYRPVFRAPRWEECEFAYDAGSNNVIITSLIRM